MLDAVRGSTWGRRVLWIAGFLAAAAIVLALAAHTAPARRFALRRAVAAAESQFGLRLRAGRLDYNLFALRAALSDVSVAAAHSAGAPFLAAERVAVQLPASAILGPFAIDRIEITGGRLRVSRGADGRTNLPEGRDNTDGEEAAIPGIGMVAAPRFDLELRDETSGVLLHLPVIDLELAAAGRVQLVEPGRVARGEVATVIEELDGGVGFDGRTVTFTGLSVETEEIDATINGTIALREAEPRLDLRIGAEVETAPLTRWVALAERPDGRVAIDAVVAGAVGSPSAAGTLRAARLAWRGVEANAVRATVAADPALVRIDSLEAQLASGEVFFTGAIPLDDRVTRVAATWHDLELGELLRLLDARPAFRPAGRISGSLDASGPGLRFEAWTIDAASRVALASHGSTPLRIATAADLDVERGEWRLALAGTEVNGLQVTGTARGRVRFDDLPRSTLAGRFELPRVPVREAIEAVRQAGVDVTAIRLDPGEPGTVRAAATVSGTLARPLVRFEGDAAIENAAALAPGTPIAGAADVRFEGTTSEVRVEAALPAIPATAVAVIAAGAPYTTVADVEVDRASLEQLLRGVETPVPVSGIISASAHVSGPLQDWRQADATLDLANLDARAGALPVSLAAPARIEYRDGAVHLPSLEVIAGDVRVSAAGSLPLAGEGGPLLVTAAGDLAQFAAAAAAAGVVARPELTGTGPAALLARIGGSIEAPVVAADVELGPGTLAWSEVPAATNVQLRVHADGTWLEVRELTGQWQGSRIDASGRAPLAMLFRNPPPAFRDAESPLREPRSSAGDPRVATLSATLASVTPAVLAPFADAATLSQIEGSIDASLRLESPSLDLADVTGELRLDRMDLRVADLPVAQQEPTRIRLAGGFARVAAWQWAGQGAELGVEGQVRLADLNAALLAGGRLDLRMLTPFTRDAGVTTAGTLQPRLSITGPLTNLRVDGVASISGGDVRLADPRVIATNLEGRLVLSRTRAQLASLTGEINGGALSATGAVEYGPGLPTEAELRFDADGMALEFPEGLRSELNADVRVALAVPDSDAARPAGSVTGTVTVLRGAYREPLAVVTGLLGALRTGRLAAQAARFDEPSLLDTLALDVRVVTDDDVVVDNNVGQLQLGADLRVIGTAAAPSLAGRAELREGGRVFLGRNIYTIESGTIDFVNPVTIEPDLHLEATTRAGGVDIRLTLDGTPSTLQSSLSAPESTEPYGQADLASLLLTGRTLENVYGDEAQVVGEQVLGYLSGDILGLAGRAVGLDTVRLGGIDEGVLRRDFTDAATELDPTSRLTVGKSFGRAIDVTFSQSLRDGDAQAWILDVRPWRSVEFRLVSNDENLRSYGFRHDVSFGANAGALGASRPPRTERPDQIVDAVRFTGAAALPEDRLREAVDHEAGDTFDFIAWQRDRDALEALYRSEGYCEARVSARRAEHAAAVTLSYEIDAGPRCSLETTGYELDAGTRARLMEAWSASVFDRFLEEEAREIASAALARQGHVAAHVQAAVGLEDGRKVLRLRMDPGPRSTAAAVRIEAGDAALAAALDSWLDDAGLRGLAAAEPGRVEQEMTAFLRSRGHLRARVSVAPPRRDGGSAVVLVDVDAGPIFTIDSVRVDGAARLAAAAVQDALRLAAGEPYDPSDVERARERLEARYRREGFTRAVVTVDQTVAEAQPAVALTFAVAEGPRQILAAVAVEGSRGIDEDVIVRAMSLPIGEPMSADAWLQARTRLFDTGLFRRVDVQAVPMEGADDPLVQPMQARVTVQEWPLLRLRYGFQVEEERPEGEVEGRDLVPGLSADVTRRTLFGRAVSLGAAVDYARRERRGRGFVNAPTMFGLPVESSLVGQWSREEVTTSTLVTDVSSLSWEQRIRLVRHLRLSYAYRFERNHTFDTSPDVDPNTPDFDSIVLDVARLNAIAAWDTRDDPSDATRGMLLSSSFEYAPEILGSDIRSVRFVGQAYFFRPWRRVVFASAARIGLATGLEGQDLIPSDRFVTGGGRSVRGAAEDALAPRDIFEIPGGEALLVLNQEVRFPIYRWLHGVGFVDAGNTFATIDALALGGLVGSYGVGLRLDTPFALLRVDFGRLFSPPSGSPAGRWSFGIGHAF